MCARACVYACVCEASGPIPSSPLSTQAYTFPKCTAGFGVVETVTSPRADLHGSDTPNPDAELAHGLIVVLAAAAFTGRTTFIATSSV